MASSTAADHPRFTAAATADAEAQFLLNRQARLDQRKKTLHQQQASENNQQQEQLTQIRQALLEWKHKCQTVAAKQVSSRQEWMALQEEFANLKTHSLSTAAVVAADQKTIMTMDSLLHAEFASHYKFFQDLLEERFAKHKFFFAKYRAAMLSLKAQERANDAIQPADPGTSNSVPKQISSALPQTMYHVESLSNATIRINGQGSVTVEAQGQDKQQLPQPKEGLPFNLLHIRNLQDCRLQIQPATLSSLHLKNCQSCTIHVEGSISGALYMDQCHRVTLTLTKSCQQVRIHDSTDLTLQVTSLTAGAILEGTTRVAFVHTNSNDAATLPVKDFGWLRSDKPSPNFTIAERRLPLHVKEAEDADRTLPEKATKTPLLSESVLCLSQTPKLEATTSTIQNDAQSVSDSDSEI